MIHLYDACRLKRKFWQNDFLNKKGTAASISAANPFSVPISNLSTETELLDDLSVSLDVDLLEVVQKLTPLAYETEKGTTGDNILLVLLHMLCEVIDTVGK